MCDETIKLWTSVRMVALDEAWAKPAPGEEPEKRRKLWPIACAEPLLKFAETLIIEKEIKEVLKKLQVRQLECGTLDAAPLLVRLMRSWAEDIYASTTLSRSINPRFAGGRGNGVSSGGNDRADGDRYRNGG